MPVDPHDILDLARAIGKLRSSDEAARRSTASRAYHAAFHAARLHVWRRHLAVPPGVHGSHQGLIEALASSPDPGSVTSGTGLTTTSTSPSSRPKSDRRYERPRTCSAASPQALNAEPCRRPRTGCRTGPSRCTWRNLARRAPTDLDLVSCGVAQPHRGALGERAQRLFHEARAHGLGRKRRREFRSRH